MTILDAKKMLDATTVAVTGNEAVAEAMRQIDPDVVCAYPITPQTEVVQLYAQMVADGKVDSEFVTVESEHSAMSAVIGSAAGGARTMTATSSQGFALMWEVLYVAASYRLPIVMTTVNRALSGPINIHCDHSDTMGGRDTGWIQIYGENQQEAYDNCLQSVRIAEHMDVRTPVMHMYDGYVISGAIGPLKMLPDEQVQQFIGPYRAVNPMLDTKHPVTVGPFDGLHGFYFEHKVSQNRAMDRAFKVIQDVADEFAEPQRPQVRPARHVPPRGRRNRHRGGGLHSRHHAHRGRQAARARRQGRHGARARVPALPRTRRTRRRCSTSRSWASWTAPTRSAPRAAPCSWRCGPRSTTATRAHRCCPSSTAWAAATSSRTTSSRRSPRSTT